MKELKREYKISSMMLGIIIMAALSSCMSLGRAGEDDIAHIVELINAGDHKTLSSMSSNPFLLDGEVLHGTAIIGDFWEGLSDAGFSLKAPEITANRMLSSSDTAHFGESAAVAAFFKKYIPEYSVTVEVAAETGRIFLILSPADAGGWKIAAWGGPY